MFGSPSRYLEHRQKELEEEAKLMANVSERERIGGLALVPELWAGPGTAAHVPLLYFTLVLQWPLP